MVPRTPMVANKATYELMWGEPFDGEDGDDPPAKVSEVMASMNAGSKKLHPDFGSDPTYGIPYILVPGSQPKVPMTFTWASEKGPKSSRSF